MIKIEFIKFLRENLSHFDIPRNKKILITGSSGFIGSYLVDALTQLYPKNNNKIYGIDRIKGKNHKNFFFYKK
jgi:FlaA1/EpsC-like NDP-sugar epimerase